MNTTTITIIFPGERSFSYEREQTYQDITSVLHGVFAEWNSGSKKECPAFLNSTCRSLMINDVVRIADQYFLCMRNGWKALNEVEAVAAISGKSHSFDFKNS